jgi:hypothetical protein
VTTYPLDEPAGRDPLAATLTRLAVLLRVSVAPFATVAALLTAAQHRSPWATVVALVAFDIWTIGYGWVARTRGLTSAVAVVDALAAGALCLAMGWITPPGAATSGAGWLSNVVSIAVICAQFVGHPMWTIPAGLAATVAYLAGARIAAAPDGGVFQAFTLVLQILIAAAVAGVLRRTGRTAVAAARAYHAGVRAQEVERLRRDAERTELTLIHNGPLTTLTLVAMGGLTPAVAAAIRTQAASDVAGLHNGPVTAGDGGAVRLPDLLDLATAAVRDRVAVRMAAEPCLVPRPVGTAIAAATAEALENVARHAGTTAATVHVGQTERAVTVSISDTGRGFDPAAVPPERFGLRESITGELTRVGGRAEVTTAPDVGTTVTLVWPA